MQKNILLAIAALVAISVASTSIYRSLKRETPRTMPVRAYATIPLEVARQSAQADIEAHRQDVAKLFEERNSRPHSERNRLLHSEQVYLSRDLKKELLEFYDQRIVQTYLETTSDDRIARDKFLPFLKAVAAWIAGESALGRDILELATAARNTKGLDPVIKIYAISVSDLSESDKMKAYTEIADRILSPEIGRFHQMYLTFSMKYLSLSSTDSDTLKQAECLYTAVDSFVNYLEEESSGSNLRLPSILFFRFFKGLSREDQRICLQACWSNGKIAPWTTHMVAGLYFDQVAWDARGRGFVSGVSETQWSDFRRFAKIAEDHLLRAWQIAPQYPEAATEMIRMAMAGNATQGTTRDWLCEAVHAQFDHQDAYSAYLFSISPRWGGSYEEQIAFAKEAMSTDRFDTTVPGILLDVVFGNMLNETGDLAILVTNPLIPATCKEFIQKLDSAIDRGINSPSNNLLAWANLVRVMTLSGEFETARHIYVKHGQGQMGTSPLGHLGLKASYVRGKAFAATGPAKDDISAFDVLNDPQDSDYEPEKIEDIHRALEQARRIDTQPESQPYYDDIETVVKQLKAYHSDQWVDLKFEKGLPGWYAHATQFDFKEEGYFEAKSSKDSQGIQLIPMARFRPPFVCEVEMPLFAEGQDESRCLGLLYGDPNLKAIYADQVTRGLMFQPRVGAVYLVDAARPYESRMSGWMFQETGPRHLRLIVWSDRIDCYVNRKFVVTLPLPEGARRDQFTLGEPTPVMGSNVMHVRNVRVRRLRMSPLPLTGEIKAQAGIELYRQLVEIDPLSPAFWFQKGYFHSKLAEHDEAVTCFSKAFELDPHLDLQRREFADALVALGRYPDAIEQYLTVLKEDEGQIYANAELAWLYATAPDDKIRNGAESLRLAERACDRSQRKVWRPLCALAAAQAELGKFTDARKSLEESLAIAPPESHEYLRRIQNDLISDRPIRETSFAESEETAPGESGASRP